MSVVANNLGWLVGMTIGDGYLDNRHIEIYNSSPIILAEVVKTISILKFPKNRIKVDIYSLNADKQKWSIILRLPQENISLRKNSSPWNANAEKVRIRISSKEIASKFQEIWKNIESLDTKDKIAFIRGLFDAEASVDVNNRIEFKQVASDKGIKVVSIIYKLLNEFKIECTSPKNKHDKKKTDIYFYVKDLNKFAKKIGFVDTEKEKKLTSIIDASKSKKIPSVEEIIKLLEVRPYTSFEIIKSLKCPYHRIQKILKLLISENKVVGKRIGRQIFYSCLRNNGESI